MSNSTFDPASIGFFSSPEWSATFLDMNYDTTSKFDMEYKEDVEDFFVLNSTEISTSYQLSDFQEDIRVSLSLQRQSNKIRKVKISAKSRVDPSKSRGWNHLRGTVFRLLLELYGLRENFEKNFRIDKRSHAQFSTKERNSYYFSKLYEENPLGFVRALISLYKSIQSLDLNTKSKAISQTTKDYFNSHRMEGLVECLGFKSEPMLDVINKVVENLSKPENEIIEEIDLEVVSNEIKNVITKYETKNGKIEFIDPEF